MKQSINDSTDFLATLNEGQREICDSAYTWHKNLQAKLASAPKQDKPKNASIAELKKVTLNASPVKFTDRCLVLQGEPGTGKTYSIRAFIGLQGVRPLLTASTNKAARQLSKACKTKAVTIHSALNLIPTAAKLYQRFQPDLSEFNVIVCDEGSMIDDDLLHHIEKTGLPVIFLADAWQLPPVEGNKEKGDGAKVWLADDGGVSFTKVAATDPSRINLSPIFYRGFRGFHLTQVMRHGGDILSYVQRIRKQVFAKVKLPPKLDDLQSIKVVSSSSVLQRIADKTTLKELEVGERKLIAWTNASVDKFNQRVRLEIFGEQAHTERFLPKDLLICTKPYMEKVDTASGGVSLSTVLTTDSMLEVVEVQKARCEPAFKHEDLYCDIIRCKDEMGSMVKLYSVSVELGQDQLMKNLLDKVMEQIKILPRGADKNQAMDFFKTWPLLFLQCKHAFALTSHRSQGSTFKNVWVLRDDIMKNRNRTEAFQSYNVACSRASENLEIVGGTF